MLIPAGWTTGLVHFACADKQMDRTMNEPAKVRVEDMCKIESLASRGNRTKMRRREQQTARAAVATTLGLLLLIPAPGLASDLNTTWRQVKKMMEQNFAEISLHGTVPEPFYGSVRELGDHFRRVFTAFELELTDALIAGRAASAGPSSDRHAWTLPGSSPDKPSIVLHADQGDVTRRATTEVGHVAGRQVAALQATVHPESLTSPGLGLKQTIGTLEQSRSSGGGELTQSPMTTRHDYELQLIRKGRLSQPAIIISTTLSAQVHDQTSVPHEATIELAASGGKIGEQVKAAVNQVLRSVAAPSWARATDLAWESLPENVSPIGGGVDTAAKQHLPQVTRTTNAPAFVRLVERFLVHAERHGIVESQVDRQQPVITAKQPLSLENGHTIESLRVTRDAIELDGAWRPHHALKVGLYVSGHSGQIHRSVTTRTRMELPPQGR